MRLDDATDRGDRQIRRRERCQHVAVADDRQFEVLAPAKREVERAFASEQLDGSRVQRLPGTLNVSFQRIEAESVLLGLDLEDVAVASGSACTEGATEPSHVLLAMGLEPRLASGAVRFSLGYGNDADQMDRVVDLLQPIVARLRELSTF